jgi:hypothetical protein
MVFDKNLYYEKGVYRTPTMPSIFSHNQLLMKDKGYLIYEKKRDDFSIIPSSGVAGITIEHLIPILTFFDNLKLCVNSLFYSYLSNFF